METKPDYKETILYVDDIQANLMLFEASFEDDYSIMLAESGKEALKLLEDNDFAAIVSDQNMPGMSGTELLEIVEQKYPEIMRFILTAYTDYSTVVDSINKGKVYAYFNKPYNIDEVRMTINKSLEVRQLKRSNQEMIVELKRANEDLVEMDKTKINFLTGITNEIRTPINKILTAVHMIKDRIDSKELTESLNLLDVSLGRLESFSNAAKLLVRMQDSSNIIKSSEISPRELIEVGFIEKRATLKDPQLNYKIDDQSNGTKVEGEFELLLTSYAILIDLVAAHAAEGSDLNFSILVDDDKLSIGIESLKSNYGEKERDILLSLFAEEDISFNKDYQIELVLAYHIVSSHKGRISVNFNEDESTVIQLELPVLLS